MRNDGSHVTAVQGGENDYDVHTITKDVLALSPFHLY